MVTVAAKKAFGARVAVVFNLVASLYLGLSPWVLVPYSDTYGMLCPSATLLVLSLPGRDRLRAALLVAFAVVGYNIKPISIFPLLAMLLIALLRARGSEGRVRLLARARSCALPALLAAVVAAVGRSWLSRRYVTVDGSAAFSLTHFLMMGSNAETMGSYSDGDVGFSAAQPAESRSAANLSVWRNRIGKMGPAGICRLALSKHLTNFSDGTFAWEIEGFFTLKSLVIMMH